MQCLTLNTATPIELLAILQKRTISPVEKFAKTMLTSPKAEPAHKKHLQNF